MVSVSELGKDNTEKKKWSTCGCGCGNDDHAIALQQTEKVATGRRQGDL